MTTPSAETAGVGASRKERQHRKDAQKQMDERRRTWRRRLRRGSRIALVVLVLGGAVGGGAAWFWSRGELPPTSMANHVEVNPPGHLSVLLPVAVLSVFRKRVDYFTFNPWLSNLPEYLASHPDPWSKKLAFLSDMALAWFLSNSPIEGVEWGFIIDVPSVVRFLLTALLFGAYFALWAHRRHASPFATGRYAGTAGAATSVMGFTTGACSVTGCGVPVLPVVGLALTGLSSGMLTFLGQLARVGTTVVLVAVAVGVVWLGWQAGSTGGTQSPRVAATPSLRSHT